MLPRGFWGGRNCHSIESFSPDLNALYRPGLPGPALKLWPLVTESTRSRAQWSVRTVATLLRPLIRVESIQQITLALRL